MSWPYSILRISNSCHIFWVVGRLLNFQGFRAIHMTSFLKIWPDFLFHTVWQNTVKWSVTFSSLGQFKLKLGQIRYQHHHGRKRPEICCTPSKDASMSAYKNDNTRGLNRENLNCNVSTSCFSFFFFFFSDVSLISSLYLVLFDNICQHLRCISTPLDNQILS